MSAARPAWTVLDTAFGDGSAFLNCCDNWRATENRPLVFHYVGVVEPKHRQPWASGLAELLDGLTEGFWRFLLEDGHISLTLCIGERHAMLTQQRMQADAAMLDNKLSNWDLWSLKAFSRCCKRGSRIDVTAGPTPPDAWLKEAGFETVSTAAHENPALIFNPPWNVLKRGAPVHDASATPSSCVVIGAGLSGASVAHLLALRGWQVTVLDSCLEPAGGASSLPVGVVAPYVSADDSPRSRWSRAGARLMLHSAAALLTKGKDWAHTGVLERRTEGDVWHSNAGWLKPAAIVRAWLNHPNIQFKGGCTAKSLSQTPDAWSVLGENDEELAVAQHLVVANAMGCQALLAQYGAVSELQHLQPLYGTMSSGPANPMAHIHHPVNGMGSYVSTLPGTQGPRWYAGATFETDPRALEDVDAQHAANFSRLSTLLPEVTAVLQPDFSQGKVDAWTGTRCVSHDRMPLVGALLAAHDSKLWISAAMGSRGLSFSALCAHLLVAQMCEEPWPVEASLSKCVAADRKRKSSLAPVERAK